MNENETKSVVVGDEVKPGDARSSSFGLAILKGLQSQAVYQGTADPVDVWVRRQANKKARAVRRRARVRSRGGAKGKG